MNIIHKLNIKIKNQLYRIFVYPVAYHISKQIQCYSINDTIKSLINTNKSLSRFGDGEMRRVIKDEDLSVQTADRFERNSELLRKRLIQVLNSNLNNLEIGLPTIFSGFKDCNLESRRFCRLLLSKYGIKFSKYLNPNKIYYNTEFSRFYIGGRSRILSHKRFMLLKKIWANKDILIIEGNKSRIGLNNNLFNNTHYIYRIECPSTNAFESYSKIFKSVLKFLNNNNNKILSLISLGPTATILSYDLSVRGYRAIDIGQLDIEYEWYLMDAKHKINIPNRYVSEVPNGSTVTPINNKKFTKEIVAKIK